MLCVGVWNINVLLGPLTACECVCVRLHVCQTAVRWHFRCFHVCLGYACACMCVCVPVSLIGGESYDCIILSCRSPSLLVSLSLSGCHRQSVGRLRRAPSSCRVVLKCCVLSLLFLLGSHLAWSQWEAPKGFSAPPHCRAWEESGRYLLFSSLLIYCRWGSESHVLHHYFRVALPTTNALVFQVWFKYAGEAFLPYGVSVCLRVHDLKKKKISLQDIM